MVNIKGGPHTSDVYCYLLLYLLYVSKKLVTPNFVKLFYNLTPT